MVWLIAVGVGVLALLAGLFWALTVLFSEVDDELTDAEDYADPDEAWVPEYSSEMD